MPARSYNEGFTHPNVIRWDGTNLDEVERALSVVLKREKNQPLCLENPVPN
jgi:hypothetical protein